MIWWRDGRLVPRVVSGRKSKARYSPARFEAIGTSNV
jgi:hypothetical protein